MKLNVIFGLVFMLLVNMTQAQNGSKWNWPEDKQTAERKNALYGDYLKSENYKAAAKELQWLLKNAPDLNPSIYINGAKIYENLAETEKDPKRQIVLEDSALLMYDKRMEFFNNEDYVRDRKAYLAYKYKNDNPESYENLLVLYKKVMEQPVNTITDNNELFYIDVARRIKAGGGAMTDDQILDIYEKVSSVLDAKIEAGKPADKINSLREKVDGVLTGSVDINCDFIDKNLAPKLRANPTDVKTANKIVTFSIAGKCTGEPIFLEAAEVVHRDKPNAGIAIVIAKKSMADGDFDRAIEFFKEASSLSDDNAKKGEIAMSLAEIASRRGQKSAARDYARQAMAADNSMTSQGYTFIGNLYFTSFDQCKGGQSMVQDRAVFIAAHEMYQKAGNSSSMAKAKEQFPSAEDIFNETKQVGDAITVSCWIGETVTVQKR